MGRFIRNPQTGMSDAERRGRITRARREYRQYRGRVDLGGIEQRRRARRSLRQLGGSGG